MNYIIAVDFDGTLCENKYPKIGEPNRKIIDYVKEQWQNGAKIVLWTCRVGELLDDAVRWCQNQGLTFDAVNENLSEVIEAFGSDTRKIFANEYIDDRNVQFPWNQPVADVLYLCDGTKCEDSCPSAKCKHTSDVSHAKNFTKGDYDSYWEAME